MQPAKSESCIIAVKEEKVGMKREISFQLGGKIRLRFKPQQQHQVGARKKRKTPKIIRSK
jgi:hypothetical protein